MLRPAVTCSHSGTILDMSARTAIKEALVVLRGKEDTLAETRETRECTVLVIINATRLLVRVQRFRLRTLYVRSPSCHTMIYKYRMTVISPVHCSLLRRCTYFAYTIRASRYQGVH